MIVNMPIDRRKALVIAAAIVGRILVFAFFPQIPELLTGQVEVSTPVSSYKRCKALDPLASCLSANRSSVQEGLFLYIRNVSPYEGGIFHQVLFLPAGGHIPSTDVRWVTGTSPPTAFLSFAWPKFDIPDNGPPLHSDGPCECQCPCQDSRFRRSSFEQTLHFSAQGNSA